MPRLGSPPPEKAPRVDVPLENRGGDESDDRIMIRLLRYLLEARGPESVARRAIMGLGLLPEVAWVDLGGSHDEMRGDVETELGPDPTTGRLRIHLVDPTDARGRARILALTRLVDAVHARELEICRLVNEAHTDPLTGLYNRRGFEPFVDQALARALRAGEDIALVLCDIDNFKAINDSCGHSAGDRALNTVAECLKQVVRPTDLAGRLGGDEMVLLLAGANASGAVHVARRLREAVARANPIDLPLTLSLGIADIRVVSQATGQTIATAREALFRAADEALYTAKAVGRDRFVCHPLCFTPEEVADDQTQPLRQQIA